VPFRPSGLLAELPLPAPGRTGWPWTVETPPTSDPDLPSITIITPAYQHARFLEETIRSVLLQNYPRLEYVVMDGGSEDGSRAIIEKYRPWLSFARNARDRGQGHAINLGFSLAAGAMRGWINSDDFYLPGALAAVGRAARQCPARFFYGDGVTVDEASGQRVYEFAPWVHQRYRQFGGLIFSHSAFWRSEIHEPVWERIRCNVDGELWLRLVPGRRLAYIPMALGAVRLQPEAKTVNPRYRLAWAEDDKEIWAVHGRAPAPRSLLRYEYRFVQRLVRWWRRRNKADRLAPLTACGWPTLPDFPL
jgi:glycosyltransferase involved in cell wall biosynthesis